MARIIRLENNKFFNLDTHMLCVEGKEVGKLLKGIPYNIIEYLAENPNIHLPQEKIRERCWKEDRGEGSVAYHIMKARAALQDERIDGKKAYKYILECDGKYYCKFQIEDFEMEGRGKYDDPCKDEVFENNPFELVRAAIANGYYNEYKIFDWQYTNNKMNQSLMEVFIYPTFKDKDKMNLSENDHFYICAPNGFGKTTFLQTLLFVSNPAADLINCDKQVQKVNELRNYYGLDGEYLALFIDLKSINESPAFNKESDLCKWLLYAAHIDDFKIKLEDLRQTLAHYSQSKKIILIFDGMDEVIKKHDSDVSKEDILEKIRLLVNADGICGNAKLVISSRPLTYDNHLKKYKYLYLNPLVNQPELVEKFIENYAPNYSVVLKKYIYDDLYMKYLITTPALLVEVITQFLLNIYDEENGIRGISTFCLIRNIIRNMMMRFQKKQFYNYREKDYDLIYERLAYISLTTDIENKKDDFAVIQDMILDHPFTLGNRRRKEINFQDISDAYEHFSLINSQERYIEFLSPEVFRPFYLANYMYKYYKYKKDQFVNENDRWEMFESISNNKVQKEEWLFDTLVFYFGILHEGFEYNLGLNTDSFEYNAWIDYVVFKWRNPSTSTSSKKLLARRIKYLVESDFVKHSCFERILYSDCDLHDNEKQIKSILQEMI